MYQCRIICLTVVLLLMAACGGSSGNGDPTPPDNDGNDGTTPDDLSVTQVNSDSVTLTWSQVEGANSYRLYYASEPITDIDNIHAHDNGDWLEDAQPPQNVSGLETHVTYYLVVTAITEGVESDPSTSVNATPSAEITGPSPTAEEVRMLELINRARFDPGAEVDRHNDLDDLNQGLDPGTISATQKPPLAFNPLLMNAARDHSAWMLETNNFSHTGEGGSSPSERIQASGYGAPELSAENISVIGRTQLDSTQAIDDHHTQLILSPGHRVNIFRSNARELGPGQETGNFEFDGQALPASMMTQKYATRGSGYFITGVVYQDNNSDGIYDVGEGMANVVVTLNGTAYPVHDSGVYSIPVANNGTYQLTIAGGDLTDPQEEEVQIMSRNVKLDVIVTGETVNTVSW